MKLLMQYHSVLLDVMKCLCVIVSTDLHIHSLNILALSEDGMG